LIVLLIVLVFFQWSLELEQFRAHSLARSVICDGIGSKLANLVGLATWCIWPLFHGTACCGWHWQLDTAGYDKEKRVFRNLRSNVVTLRGRRLQSVMMRCVHLSRLRLGYLYPDLWWVSWISDFVISVMCEWLWVIVWPPTKELCVPDIQEYRFDSITEWHPGNITGISIWFDHRAEEMAIMTLVWPFGLVWPSERAALQWAATPL